MTKVVADGTVNEWISQNEHTNRIEIRLARRHDSEGSREEWRLSEQHKPTEEGEKIADGQDGKGKKDKRGKDKDVDRESPKDKKPKRDTDEPTWRNLFVLKRSLENSFGAGFSIQRQAEDPSGPAWLKALPEYPRMVGLLAQYTSLCHSHPFWADLSHVSNMLQMKNLHKEEELKIEFAHRKAQLEQLGAEVASLSDCMRRMLAARVQA